MKSRLTTLLLALVAAGCSITPTPITTQSGKPVPAARIYQAELTVPSSGHTAKVSFLRDAGLLGYACTYKILVNGRSAFAIRSGEYQTLYLAPGQYVFELETEGGILPCPKFSISHNTVLSDGAEETYRILIPSPSGPRVVIIDATMEGSRDWATEAQAQEYTAPNGMVSLNVPKAPNFAGVPYKVTPLDTKGDQRYDKVMLHADDFGQYLVVGVRMMPPPAVAAMDKDEPRQVLRNLSEATLTGWRPDLGTSPEVAEESFRDSKYGDAIVRVYRARKGSILVKAQGRRPTQDDAFDTNIASIVARRGAVVVFVLAQDDSSPDDSKKVGEMAADLFDNLRVSSVP